MTELAVKSSRRPMGKTSGGHQLRDPAQPNWGRGHWSSNLGRGRGCDGRSRGASWSRGGQIIRNWRGLCPQCVVDAMQLRCGRGPTWTRRGADGESAKTRKTRKKCGQCGKYADGTGKARQRRGIGTCGPYRCDLLFVDKKWWDQVDGPPIGHFQ